MYALIGVFYYWYSSSVGELLEGTSLGDIDDAVSHLRQAVHNECAQRRADIEFLQVCHHNLVTTLSTGCYKVVLDRVDSVHCYTLAFLRGASMKNLTINQAAVSLP